jgi:hypothetical protein
MFVAGHYRYEPLAGCFETACPRAICMAASKTNVLALARKRRRRRSDMGVDNGPDGIDCRSGTGADFAGTANDGNYTRRLMMGSALTVVRAANRGNRADRVLTSLSKRTPVSKSDPRTAGVRRAMAG